MSTTLSDARLQESMMVVEDGPATPPAARFAEALQPRLMGPRIAAVLGGRPTCHVLDAKYEPGVRATVLYECAGGLLRGDLLTTDDPGDVERPVAVVAPGVRVCRFPHDPDLPALPQVMDPVRLGPELAGALQIQVAGFGRPAAVRCRISLLRYRPGKRVTVLVAFVGEPNRYVAKAYHDPAKAAAVAEEAATLSSATRPHGVLRFAPTVAHLPELSLVVQQRVGGTPLDALLGSRGSGLAAQDAVRCAARALAELHDSAVVTSRQRPVERELQRFRARAGRIGSVDPRLGAATAQLADRLLRVRADLPPARMGPVHGDCKPSQFMVDAGHVYLMDLDHVGVSDQAGDVGTFLASLRQLVVRRSLAGRRVHTSGGLAELSELFLETYLEARDDGRSRTRIRWQEAVALERKALRAFARAPRSPLASALVTEADRCLDRLMEAQ